MARRGKREPEAQPSPARAPEPSNRPFAEAAATLKAALAAAEAEAESARRAAAEVDGGATGAGQHEEERAMLDQALEGVRPLADRSRVAPPRAAASTAPHYDEDADALAKLAAMVEGGEPLGNEFSEEHAEWIADDADPAILPRLVAGEFAWQDHIDLHGMTRDQAHDAVYRFLAAARVKHLRCVLIVHGRGHHSEGQIPVLKLALQRWLRRAPLKAWVFAWATARPVDGGPGAIYVMIRD